MTGYSERINQAKGNGEFAKASALVVSYQGMVETVQWAAGLAGLDVPPLVAQFLCGVAVAVVAMVVRRVRNRKKNVGRP